MKNSGAPLIHWYSATTAASIGLINSTTTDPIPPKPKNKVDIQPSKQNFYYGNCALIAIAQAFDMPVNALVAVCDALKMNKLGQDYKEEGLSFYQCKKIINHLAHSYRCTCTYIPNRSKVTYNQMLLLLNLGKYLTMWDIHLSYAEKGIIYDSYLHHFGSSTDKDLDITRIVPTGWWKVNT